MYRARGMTLIEMVMAIVIVSIVLAATAPIIGNTFQSYMTTRSALDTMSKARLAVERIAREIRDVNFAAAPSPGAYQFTPGRMNPADVQFTKVGAPPTVVTIATRMGPLGPELALNYDTVPGGPYVLADQLPALGSLNIRYLREDGGDAGAPPVTAANVRFVEITLTLSVPNNAGATRTERTRVALRDKS